MRTLRALATATHLGPTLAVTVLAALLALAFAVPLVAGVLMVVAVFLNQVSVGISNDAFDVQRDHEATRVDKPLVRGDLSIRTAWVVAGSALVGSLALSVLVHPLVAVWQGVFLLAGWAYNAGLKSTVWSGACYAAGFGALPILVSYGHDIPQFPPWWVVFIAAMLGLSAHFANVLPDLLVDRRQGVRGLPQRLGSQVVPSAVVVLTLASGLALVVGAGQSSLWFTAPAALGALALAVVAAKVSTQETPGALPFQLSLAAALVMALGLAGGLAL
jgi:4-hydroxybenzoate polyprenyltransferase